MSENIWRNQYNPFNGMKVLCWYKNMKAIRTGNFIAPVNIAIDLLQGTSVKKRCGSGFKCDFCMSDWKENEQEAMIPFDVLKSLPEFWNSWGVKSICVAGHHSDPSMYNNAELIKFLRLCNHWNIEIGFVSNGAYLSKFLIEEIARTCKWCGFSINSGTAEDHHIVSGSPIGTFNKIISNIVYMSEYIKAYDLSCNIGYKFLITDNNYKNIYKGIELASKIGVRHFQLRPTDLQPIRSEKIDIIEVENQIKKGLDLEVPGKFEVFGIREKFSKDFKKVTPWKCIASPLGSTWKANGNIVICPDSRHTDNDNDRILCNFITDGLENVRRSWGSAKHKKMIDIANEKINDCHRCTSIHWHNLYRETVLNDSMDLSLI